MKALNLLILFISLSYGSIFKFKTFQANFNQTITNTSNTTIKYSGKLFLKQPDKILWQYTTPVEKNVYINGNSVMIAEPELEQVILSKLDKEVNLFKILQDSQTISKNKYQNTINGITYIFTFKNDTLQSIDYQDNIDNIISIKFSNTIKNKPINDDFFNFMPDDDWDVINNTN